MRDNYLEGFGKFITYLIGVLLLLGLIYYCYLPSSMGILFWMQISDELFLNGHMALGNSLNFLAFFAILGVGLTVGLIYGFVNTIFYPKTNEELKLREIRKENEKKYSPRLARLLNSKLRYEFRIIEKEKEIKEYKRKHNIK